MLFPVVATIWPLIGRGTTVVKKFILYVFPFGPGAWLWGTLYIDRQNHKDTITKLDKECEAIKSRSNKIVIFPEGTRSQEDELLPFKKGPFHIAIQSQSMIQPIVVSKYHFLSDKRKVFGRGITIPERDIFFDLFQLIKNKNCILCRSYHHISSARNILRRIDQRRSTSTVREN